MFNYKIKIQLKICFVNLKPVYGTFLRRKKMQKIV